MNRCLISLAESWGFHMGHFLTNLKYGMNSAACYEQKITYSNSYPVSGLSSHFNLLEDFNPQRIIDDPFYWIPQGLYYDLFDDRNDNNATPQRVPLIDNVSGYTNSLLFNALDVDIQSLPAYKSRLLNENNNWQSNDVTTIFSFYGY